MNFLNNIITRRSFKFVILFVMLSLVCIVPLLHGLYADNRTTVSVESSGDVLHSISETSISQTIHLQGKASNLNIYFNVETAGTSVGEVHISVVQNNTVLEQYVPISELETGFCKIEIPLRQIAQGTAIITVSAVGLSAEADISISVSHTLISGLPAAIAGTNEPLSGPMVLRYDVFKHNKYFTYNTALIIALVFTITLTTYFLTYRKAWLMKHNYLFLFSFAIIFLHISIKNPVASFWGEPISEAAYEFWYKAHEWGFSRSSMTLMSDEALAWLERFIIYAADKFSGSGKYVFVFAQLMELIFICAVVSMPCLNAFRKYFSDEVRLFFCFFIGAAMVFNHIYRFYCTSYWGIFFLIVFAFLDMGKMKMLPYAGGIVLTAILCVSRIYYVVSIPIALFLIFTIKNKRGIRFLLYCFTLIIFSSFEGFFTWINAGPLMQNANFWGNVAEKGLLQIFGNTIYYQVQIYISLLIGRTVPNEEMVNRFGTDTNGILINVFVFLVLVILISYYLYKLLSKKQTSLFPVIILSLFACSFGAVMMNVITSGNWTSISFPHNYSAPVNWSVTFFQQADHHFIMSYAATAFLLMSLLYRLKVLIAEKFGSVIRESIGFIVQKPTNTVFQTIGMLIFACLVVVLCSHITFERQLMNVIPTEWRAVYQATRREYTYYLPINVDYPVAWISLWHNSQGMIFAHYPETDGTSVIKEWLPGISGEYIHEKPYHRAVVGDVSDIENKYVLSLSAKRAITNFDTVMYAVFYDIDGNEITRLRQKNSPDRLYLDFLFDEDGYPFGYEKIYSVSFFFEDGLPAYVTDALQFGISSYIP